MTVLDLEEELEDEEMEVEEDMQVEEKVDIQNGKGEEGVDLQFSGPLPEALAITPCELGDEMKNCR